jgi:hypothetical protein
MVCDRGTVTVEAPGLVTREPQDYGAFDKYIRVLQVAMDGHWQDTQYGERAVKMRSLDIWQFERVDDYGLPVPAYRHIFDVQPGYYYRVV